MVPCHVGLTLISTFAVLMSIGPSKQKTKQKRLKNKKKTAKYPKSGENMAKYQKKRRKNGKNKFCR